MITVYKPHIEILIATLLPELVVKDCKSTAIMGNPEQMQLR